jgi:replicative DNA helicase
MPVWLLWILVNNENYYRVLESLRPEDFYLDAHRVIFRQRAHRARAIDLITIQEELVRASQLESASGFILPDAAATTCNCFA